MATNAISSNYLDHQASSKSTSSSSAYNVSEEQFLNILCAELQYQDPLDPQTNSEFASQLAQFTQVNTLTDINDNIETLSILNASINSYQSLGFIGRTIEATGNSVDYEGNTVNLGFTLKKDAAKIAVTVYDNNGSAVRTITMDPLKAGEQTCSWDGKDNYGNTVSKGSYTYKIAALDAGGKPVTSTTTSVGKVTGVTYDNGITYLMVGDKKILISDVTKINE